MGCLLLWRDMHSPFMYWLEHVHNNFSHVSVWLFGHSVQFGFRCVVGLNIVFR